MTTRLLVVATCLSFAPMAGATWSDNDLAVADRSGEQAQPKIVPTADGGAYVSWFDNSTGGYDVYLQRLDAAGNELWAHNGVLVADRGFSSTQNYGLSVDTSGNALLVFRDDRFTGVQITANRIRPDGALIWGVNGVQLTNDSAFNAAPGITGTSDGSIVVAWTSDDTVKVQKLDAVGSPQWGAGATISDAGGGYFLSDIHGSDSGNVIVSLVHQPDRRIHAQKFDSTGVAMWNGGSPVIVFDNGSLQFGNFPPFTPDGSGGAVFGWYITSPLQCYAQRILADGTEAFPHNGSVGSTNAAQLRVSPSVDYDAITGSTYLFWTETNSLQSMDGVSGQRFDGNGNRQWTDNGKVVRPLQSTERTFVRTTARPDGAIVSFLEGGFGTKTVQAARLATDGSLSWTPSLTTVSDAVSGKSRLATTASGGKTLHVWQDSRNDANDIYGQNLNSDGSTGAASCPADTDGDGVVNVTDLIAVILAWGTSDPDADINNSGTVDVVDLLEVILAWGPCP